tara:strand:- start:44166 stop:45089 length:924 start_codon:yes stop_codon:yes gene_type:complete
MKKLLLIITLSMTTVFAGGESLLDNEVQLESFGKIKYRAPMINSDKLPIVLFHGIYGGASHRTWRKILPILEEAGERVYIMDLPGVGESDRPKKAYKIEDFDEFVEAFLTKVVKQRATVVSESLLSAAVLKVTSERPDLIRRTIIINPSGVNSLNDGPSQRQQALYDRLYNNDAGAIGFYQNLLTPNSIKYFLSFGFYDDSLVNDELIADFTVARSNLEQRWLTLSFVGGQLFRPFVDSANGIFSPVLALFGEKYENFQDTPAATAKDFENLRPDFTYVEIKDSGSSIQREKPRETAKEIIIFAEED